MALSPEDKGDVKKAFGKALANKVSKVTKDKNYGGIGKERVGKTDDKGWQIETKKKPKNPRFRTSYGYAGGKMYGDK